MAKRTTSSKKKTSELEQTHGKVVNSPTKKTKKDIQDMEQVHGKLEGAVSASKKIDKILGMRQKNPFGVTDQLSFDLSLKGKNLTDLRELAVAVGVFPNGNPTLLRNKLRKAFAEFIRGKDSSSVQIPMNNSKLPNSDLQQKINSIWQGKK
jgi:hypothetical protein|tara:strand:- start:965 stop:1417 length:453 start_codon:yes stop_codon:yes gene_type:complete